MALDVLRTGEPRLLHYDTGSDEETVWGLGLGCEGAVDVFVQLAERNDAIGELLAARTPFAIVTLVEGPHAGRTMVASRVGARGSTGDSALDADLARRAATLLEQGT